MTIPDGAPEGAKEGDAPTAEPRVRRRPPDRAGPNRAAGADAGPSPHGPSEASVNEQIASAVRAGYDVIAENIQQGRAAAERFRQGDYNIRDVPDDVEAVLLRLIQLARELSSTTLDVCERLVKEVRGQGGGTKPAPESVPPFRPFAPGAPVGSTTARPQVKLTVRFEGSTTAVSRTSALDRPRQATAPQELVAGPLATRDPAGGLISQVAFQTDVSIDGLVALVTVPPGLAAGVYSGLVRAPHDDLPLGVLTVEIP
ncbi:MAG TPA: hypothetical protein VFH92_08500 [Phenylobacterium sp.]|nr:hypothetical protein [Phenylobacterium sp.]